MPVTPITTERLLLRQWAEADARTALDIYSREDVYRWLGNPPRPWDDLDAATARIEKWASISQGSFGFWAIETPGVEGIPPQPCGTVLLVDLPRSDGVDTDVLEIGWHMHPAAWGRGIATEAARGVLDLARADGVTQVHAVVYPDNTRSLAVCDRLGMTRLGPTDEWYGVELVDHVLAL